MRKEFRAIVSGKVQMVMYRDFAQRNARTRDVVGTVKNLPDKTVEVVAQGEETKLLSYIERLRKGSFLSRVEKVDVEWREPSHEFQGFSIVY